MNSILKEDINLIANNKDILNHLSGKTVLVTGATGLIGSLIVMSLLEYSKNNSPIKVVGLVRSKKKAKEKLMEYFSDSNLIFIEQDIQSPINFIGNVDYIIHAASITSSQMFVKKPVDTINTAIYGSENILEFSKQKKVKGILYLSSLEVYGTFDNYGENIKFVTEKEYGYIDILNPRSSYSEGKKMVENIFSAYYKQYDVPIKIARLTQTFGAGVDYEDKRVFAEFARNAVEKKNIELHTKGETVRNYCYTVDAIMALFYILIKGENGKAYNVASDDTTISIYNLAKLYCENKKISVVIKNDVDMSMGYNPIVKISLNNDMLKELGWKSNYNIKEMVHRFIKYFEILQRDSKI